MATLALTLIEVALISQDRNDLWSVESVEVALILHEAALTQQIGVHFQGSEPFLVRGFS